MSDQVEIKITAYLTRNNSDQDKQDDAAWERLRQEVIAVLANEKYDGIAAWVSG